MIVEAEGILAAVGVERFLGTENVMVRPLSRYVLARPVIGGASLDALGNPQPVLDPAALVGGVYAANTLGAIVGSLTAMIVLVGLR